MIISHIERDRRSVPRSYRVRATAWCGYQALIGQYLHHPYSHLPSRARLVRPEFKAYSLTFLPAMRPAEPILPESQADQANCPNCRSNRKQRVVVASPQVAAKAARKQALYQ